MHFVFFGTPDFAVTILNELTRANHTPLLIVTAPEKSRGRGGKTSPTPVAIWAREHDILTVTPHALSDTEFFKVLTDIHPDLFIVAAYGKIIPKRVLDIPKHGTLNVHPSLLPKYRGASPIEAALRTGEKETGVSIMLMDEKLDHGPVLAVERYAITEHDDRITLTNALAKIGGALFARTMTLWVEGRITPTPQNDAEATHTSLVSTDDARIDWSKSAEAVSCVVRAYRESPGAWTILDGKRIRIEKIAIISRPREDITPGSLVIQNGALYIATNDYLVQIDRVKPEGKKEMDGIAFARGLRAKPDLRFDA